MPIWTSVSLQTGHEFQLMHNVLAWLITQLEDACYAAHCIFAVMAKVILVFGVMGRNGSATAVLSTAAANTVTLGQLQDNL